MRRVPVIRGLRRTQRETILGIALLLPGLAGLLLFVMYPVVSGVVLSFYRLYLLEGPGKTFCGIDNYLKFFQNPLFWSYWKNTFIWTVGSLGGQLAVGLVFALLLNQNIPLRWFWRSMALIPWVMPTVVASVIWQWILNGEWGILNYILKTSGLIRENVLWLSTPQFIWPAVLVVSIWKGYPLAYALLLAALQGIPKDIYDAARIDGANRWKGFLWITLPLLRPTLFVLVLLGTIWEAQSFTAIWTLTRGGPGNYTMTIAPLVYTTSFQFFRMGEGAAMAVPLMIVLMIFAVVYLKRVRFSYQ